MLSVLSRGYCSWTGDLNPDISELETETVESLPEVGPAPEYHRHGITVTPRSPSRVHTARSSTSSPCRADGQVQLPKTFSTRKGALLLYTAPESPLQHDQLKKRLPRKPKQQELIDLSLKLGTMEKLSMSVLQYGDPNYDRDSSSVTDKGDGLIFKFLHELNEKKENCDPLKDRHAQPGGELKFYLQDLKQRASARGYGREGALSSRARSQELEEILQQLEDAWPVSSRPASQWSTSVTDGSHGKMDEFLYPNSTSILLGSDPTRPMSFRKRVLSSNKLASSLKSLNYMGRPSTESRNISVASPDGTLFRTLPQHHVGTHRSKSAYWSSTSGSTDPLKRPKTSHISHHRFTFSKSDKGSFVSPDPMMEDVPLKIEEESGTQLSEDDILGEMTVHVAPAMKDEEFSSVVLHENVLDKDSETDRVSISTSVREEEEIVLSEDEVEEAESSMWVEFTECPVTEGRTSVMGAHTPINESDANDTELNATKPLQPQYAGMLQDDSAMQEFTEREENQFDTTVLQGSRSSSKSESNSSLHFQTKHSTASAASSRCATQLGMNTQEQDLTLQDSAFDGLVSDAPFNGKETIIHRMEDSSPHMEDVRTYHPIQKSQKQEKIIFMATGSVDMPDPDPETLVSLEIDDEESNNIANTDQPIHSKNLVGTPYEAIKPSPGIAESLLAPSPPEIKSHYTSQLQISQDVSLTLETKATVEEIITKKVEVNENVALKEKHETAIMAGIGPELAFKMENRTTSIKPQPILHNIETNVGIREHSSSSTKAQQKLLPTNATAMPEKAKLTPPNTNIVSPPPKKLQASSQQRTQGKGNKPDKKKFQTKGFVKALDVTSVHPDKVAGSLDSASKTVKKAAKKESYRPPPPPPRVTGPVEEHLLIPDHLKEAIDRRNSRSQNELENELRRMHQAVDESLGVSQLIVNESEGLTEEELLEAQEALKERLEEAQRKMLEAAHPSMKKIKVEKTPEIKAKKTKSVKVIDEKLAAEMAEREARKEQQRLERQKRLEEVQLLQQKILEKEAERKAQEEEAARRAIELAEEVELARQEEEAIKRAEEEAREQLAALRKIQREEREMRRKAELEKKKQDAIARREKQKKMMEAARKKEQEMLDRIADGEMRRALHEEEQRKRDEEERLAQEKFEEELYLAQMADEEEERKLQELEKQAEEEAFERITSERDETERHREELELQARKIAEEEEHLRQQLLQEEKLLEEERLRREAEEKKRIEEERQRLKELQKQEDAARAKMRDEIEARRQESLKRREVNLERQHHLDGLRHSQGVTESWVFSYFVLWPNETYKLPMGEPADGKKKGNKGKKKK